MWKAEMQEPKQTLCSRQPLLQTQRTSLPKSFAQTVSKLKNLQHAYAKLTTANIKATDVQQFTAKITAEIQQAIYLGLAEVQQLIYLPVAAWLCGCLFVPVLLVVRVALLCCVVL